MLNECRLVLEDPELLRRAEHQIDSIDRGDLLRLELRIAAGNDHERIGICP